jgi:ureidoglycolate hydrolase
MKTTVVSVGTTPTLVVNPDDLNRYVYLQIVTSATIYVGDGTVTTDNGMPLEKHTAPHQIFLPLKQTMYAVVTAQVGTADLRVMTPDVD